MYKLLAIDMDGTLLDDYSLMPENTYAAVEYLKKNKIEFVLATGRPLLGVLSFYDDLKLNSPIITNNGAMVYKSKEGPLIFNNTMAISDALKVIELNDRYNCTICMWHDQKLYVNNFNQYAFDYAKITGITPLDLKDLDLKNSHIGPTKFVFREELSRIEEIKDEVASHVPQGVTALTTRADFLEIFSSDNSKGIALRVLGEHLNIDPKEMIAVGDGYNDIEMIRYAGLSVVVDNAPSYVKSFADYIGCSNNEGIVDHIVENLLKK